MNQTPLQTLIVNIQQVTLPQRIHHIVPLTQHDHLQRQSGYLHTLVEQKKLASAILVTKNSFETSHYQQKIFVLLILCYEHFKTETESENELSTSYSSDHSNSTTTTTTVHERSHSSTSRRDTSQTNTNLQHSTFQSTNNHSKNFASSNKQSSSPTCSMPSANSPINCNIFHSQQLDINENKTPTKSHPFNQSHPISKINGNSNNNINNNPVNSRKKQTRIQRAGCHSLSSPTTNDPKMKISLNDIHMFISQKLRQLHEVHFDNFSFFKQINVTMSLSIDIVFWKCPDENIKRQEPLILGLQQRFLCRQTTSTTSDNSSNPTNPSTPTSTTTTTVTASISTTTFTHQSIGTIHKTFLTSMTTSLPNSNPPPIPPRTQS